MKLILLLFIIIFSQDKAVPLLKGEKFTADQDYVLLPQNMANEIKFKVDSLQTLKKIHFINDSIIYEYKRIVFRDSVMSTLLNQKISYKDSVIIQYKDLIKTYDDYLKTANESIFTKYKFWFGCGAGIIIYSAITIQFIILK